MATEIDAAHVLSSYSAAILKASNQLIRDARELPYPKEVIKQVLMHCIKLSGSGKEREFLRHAYVCLADFQTLSDDERSSLEAWNSVMAEGTSAGISMERTQEMAKMLSNRGDLALEVKKRAAADAAVLLEELEQAGL